ncbi:tigger transposable element-derived protein 1-like [Palaemon carinicauda]|uniref:tigger transposable element-derived protein 1-like n=1 Tax=Palaemon carinicauda TaxID=392227 RepID=UPI0035B62AC2
MKTAKAFVKTFDKLTVQEGYSPQHVFNWDETVLFLEKLTRRTYTTAEEKRLPGHNPMRTGLPLHSGDCKVKPLLVYHFNTPRAFKTHKVTKENLYVLWRANRKAWVRRQLFIEWINVCFGSSGKKYLEEKRHPMKYQLVLDNALAHSPALDEDRCFEIIESTNLTLRQFWKEHFDIHICLKIIDQAWQEVSRHTLNSAWKSMSLEVDEANIDELIEEHQEEFTTDDVKELKAMRVNVVQEDCSEGEEDDALTKAEIKDGLDG